MKSIEEVGMSSAYEYVDASKVRVLPQYVDRVPLLFDGQTVTSDEDLFNLFKGGAIPSSNGPVDSKFSASYSDIEGISSKLDNVWDLESEYEPITTPECEPMPKKGST